MIFHVITGIFSAQIERKDEGQVLSHVTYCCVNMQYCVQNNEKLTYDNKTFISNL